SRASEYRCRCTASFWLILSSLSSSRSSLRPAARASWFRAHTCSDTAALATYTAASSTGPVILDSFISFLSHGVVAVLLRQLDGRVDCFADGRVDRGGGLRPVIPAHVHQGGGVPVGLLR